MIIYNKDWLHNLQLHQQFEDDYAAGALTQEELKRCKQQYPILFYRPGIFIWIGLFILTCIIVSFSAGLLGSILVELNLIDNFGWALALGAIIYFINEKLVKQNHYFHSGVDNALLYIAAGSFIGGFAWMISNVNPSFYTIGLSAFILALNAYFTMRFADLLTTAMSGFAFLALIFFTWYSIGSFGVTTMPFMMMLASAGIYFAAVKWSSKSKAAYYQNCLIVTKVIGLLALYASGNYFVVQQLSAEINGAAPGAPVPFGFIFWGWTVLLPFAYIAWGIKHKDLIRMRTGLMLVAGAVYTFRYYFHLMPIELALTIGGIVLLGVSYAIIKYLKVPKHGFTYAELNRKNLLDQLNVESMIVGETFSQTPGGPSAPDSPYGGGSAGGGGSSGGF